MSFFFIFLFSWAFSISIHDDQIIVQRAAAVDGDILHENKDLQPIIFVTKGATFVNNGIMSNAIILEVAAIHKIKKIENHISIKKDHKLENAVKPIKKIIVLTFYKKPFESFDIVKLDDTKLSLVTNYSFSGRVAILSTFIFSINALFFSSILSKKPYDMYVFKPT